MSLIEIVKRYGGEGFHGYHRASIPAPGHKPHDRSISLFLDPNNGQVRVHSFTATHTWQDIIQVLREDQLIDAHNIITGGAGASKRAAPITADPDRLRRANHIWSDGYGLHNSLSERYLRDFRNIKRSFYSDAFRHHPAVPASVYDLNCKYKYPCFASKITANDEHLIGVEITYLAPNGARLERLRIPRKTVGNLMPYSNIAVRIDPVADEMLVGEGVPTSLSASEYLQLPCWALLSADNFAKFIPPPGLKRLVIAGERDKTSFKRSRDLIARALHLGIKATVEYPPKSEENGFDFNKYMGGSPT